MQTISEGFMGKRKINTRILNRTQKYQSELPPLRIVEKIMDAGQENPFVSQLFCVLISKRIHFNELSAPLNFIVCIDLYRINKVFEIKERNFDLDFDTLLLIALNDTITAAHSIALEASRQGLGTNYMSHSVERVAEIRQLWKLPELVIPYVTIPAGYPDEDPVDHHYFPRKFIYFEDEYIDGDGIEFADLFYDLDSERNLIEYYRMISEQDFGAGKFSDWFDLLKRNYLSWTEKKSELKEIFQLCGLKSKI
jgi:hypothetical protein